jgi:hypothetical protein
MFRISQKEIKMDSTQFVAIRLAVQGNGVVPYNVAVGTTVGDLKKIANLNPHLEIRIDGDKVEDTRTFTPEDEGTAVIGTKAVKGGIA